MSINENRSLHVELSAHLQAARAEVREAMRAMDALVSHLISDDGITDVDWLAQIDQLLEELDPAGDVS